MKRYIITAFLLILTLIGTLVRAQTVLNIDSLKKVLAKEKGDSLTIHKKIKIIETVFSTETEPLLLIGNWSLEKARAIKNNYLEAYAQMALGFAYLYTDRVNDEVGKHFTAALRISELYNYHDLTAQTYNGLANLYRMGRQPEKYEEYTLKSIEASKKAKMLIGVAHGNYALALTRYNNRNGNLNEVHKAIRYQQEAIQAAESLKDSLTLIVYYLSISNYYAELKNFDTASLFLEKSKIIIDKKHSENDNMSYYYFKGSLFQKKGEYATSIENYNKAIEYAHKYKSRSFEIRIYKSLIKIFREQGDFKQALHYFEQAKAFDDSLFTKENFAKAADVQNKYEREKKDNEINRLNTAQQIRQLQLEKQEAIIAGNFLEAKRKENEIKLLSQEKELQELQLVQQEQTLGKNKLQAKADSQQIQLGKQAALLQEKQISDQKQTRNYLIGGLALLGLLAFVLYRNITAKKKAYIQLQDKSEQIKEQALQLSKQTRQIAQFQSQMNPHFVYNALHNIQGLVLTDEKQKANTQIQSLAQLMRKTFANAEKDDIPVEEEINYLRKYIEFEKGAFGNNLNFEVAVTKDAEGTLIPPMMIQPLIENSIKHAELKKIENPYIKVLIEIENNLLSIQVKDNGTGIKKNINEPDKLSHSMSVLKSRLDLIFKGNANISNEPVLSIKSVPEITEGTSIKFYLPLNYSY